MIAFEMCVYIVVIFQIVLYDAVVYYFFHLYIILLFYSFFAGTLKRVLD